MFVTLDLIFTGRLRHLSVETIQSYMEKFAASYLLMFRPPLHCAFMALMSILINARYGGLALSDTYDTAVLTNHALVTIKVDAGDSPPWRPRACMLLRTLCPIKLTFLIAVN